MNNFYSEESFLEAFGGQVSCDPPQISEFGEFEVKFSREIIFPRALVENLIPNYLEIVPDTITD